MKILAFLGSVVMVAGVIVYGVTSSSSSTSHTHKMSKNPPSPTPSPTPTAIPLSALSADALGKDSRFLVIANKTCKQFGEQNNAQNVVLYDYTKNDDGSVTLHCKSKYIESDGTVYYADFSSDDDTQIWLNQ